MFKNIRKFMIALCVMTLAFTTCAFAAESASQTEIQDLTPYVKSFADQIAKAYGGISKTELEYMIDNSVGSGKQLAEGIYEYAKNDSLGNLLSVGSITITKDGDVYRADVPLTYEKGDMTLTLDIQYLLEDLRIVRSNVSFRSSAGKKPLGDVMKNAGVNTVIGISVVFVMLAFMSIIIAQFKHINKLAQRKDKKTDTAEEEGINNAVSQIVENESSLADDLELIAVITAAIAASEDAPADGFTVRSVRRVRF